MHLNDVFHTVQGEGHNVGRRALFVRMPFCNLACSWCDTQFNSYKAWTVDEFLDFARREPTRFAVITGGEPTMNKVTPQVATLLRGLGFWVATETNGHFPIPSAIDWVTVSPKRDRYKDREPYYIHPEAYYRASEFKYVVDDDFDFSILDRHVGPGNRHGVYLWLSPEHTKWATNVARILEYTRLNPAWRLNLQTHKLIGVP